MYYWFRRRVKEKAPGIDENPNSVMRLLASKSPALLTRIFQACLDLGVHPNHFKRASTIIPRKPNKADYSDLLAYRLIAFFNIFR